MSDNKNYFLKIGQYFAWFIGYLSDISPEGGHLHKKLQIEMALKQL